MPTIKRRFYRGFALLLLVGGTVFAQSEGAPNIEFETLKHDLGRVPAETELDYVYTFKNTGTAPGKFFYVMTTPPGIKVRMDRAG